MGNPNPIGRNPKKKLTAEQRAELPVVAKVLTKEQVAAYFGITKKTLLRMFKDEPELDAIYNAGKAQAIAGVGNNLIKKAMEGNVKAMEFFLATQAGWTKTEKVEQAVKVASFEDMYKQEELELDDMYDEDE